MEATTAEDAGAAEHLNKACARLGTLRGGDGSKENWEL